MTKDPDYIEPKVLKQRAAKGGGVEVKPGRPVIRRPNGEGLGVSMAPSSQYKFVGVRVSSTVGVKVAGGLIKRH